MQTLRQSMSWMHTWTGLLLGWVLYFMFLTGSAGYYDTELDRWMAPERSADVAYEDPAPLVRMGIEHGLAEIPAAETISVFLPYERSFSPYVRVYATGKSDDGETISDDYALLADGSVATEGRETAGGQALYRMHWTFHYVPRIVGEIFAGLAAVFMFAAIVSGIITHKKIFKDFFTLRVSKGQRSWLDAHNVISVMTLPFQIMITFSGILLVVTTFFLPIFVAQYGYDKDTQTVVAAEMFGIEEPPARSGVAAPVTEIAPLIAAFKERFPGERMRFVTVKNAGDETATIQLYGDINNSIQRDTPNIVFDGANGALLETSPRAVTSTMGVVDVLEGLHEGLFAGPILRVLYFVSGLMGAGMIATGLVLWTTKRRQKLRGDENAERNLIIIERMNVGVVAGLPIAIAAYFYGNRLLPIEMTGRADWEIHTLFITWLACVIHALARPPSKSWAEQLIAAAVVFAFIPVLNALTSSVHLAATLPLPGRPGEMALAGVDLWFLVISVGFAYAARKSLKNYAGVAPQANKRPSPVAVAQAAE